MFPCTPEYTPAASQCQTSTAAPRSGRQVDASTTVSLSVSGTPALPSVMSRRTFWSSTKYGPSVCSGARTHDTAPEATPAGPALAESAAFHAPAVAAPASSPPSLSSESRLLMRVSSIARE